MFVGTLRIVLHIPQSQSLKDKRQVVKGIIERLKNKFNISVAEVDDNDLWQRATIGIAFVANEGRFVDQVLGQVENFVGSHPEAILVDCERGQY